MRATDEKNPQPSNHPIITNSPEKEIGSLDDDVTEAAAAKGAESLAAAGAAVDVAGKGAGKS